MSQLRVYVVSDPKDKKSYAIATDLAMKAVLSDRSMLGLDPLYKNGLQEFRDSGYVFARARQIATSTIGLFEAPSEPLTVGMRGNLVLPNYLQQSESKRTADITTVPRVVAYSLVDQAELLAFAREYQSVWSSANEGRRSELSLGTILNAELANRRGRAA